MNVRLFVLAVGTFAIGTGSFFLSGLLEDIAAGVGVSVAASGNLVTVFAVTYTIAAPVLATLLANAPRRGLLLAAISVFALANLVSAFAPTFGALVLLRILAALGAAAFTPNAVAVASGLAAPGERGKAISIITGGLTIAFVLGIPLGTFVGSLFGWRSTFILVGGMSLIAVAGVGLLPRLPSPPAVSFTERVGLLKRPEILAAMGVMAFSMMGGFVAFAYMGPLLGAISGFGGGGISALLLLFGVAAMVGNSLGGYGADNLDYRRFVVVMCALQISALAMLSVLASLSGGPLVVAVLFVVLMVWGISGFAFNPLQQHRMTRLAPEAENIAVSLNSSSIYLGQGIGAALGGLAISLGSVAWLGVVGALASAGTLAVVLLFAKTE